MKTLTVDLHTHLLEKEINPEAFWRAVQKRKLDAVAITEHIEENPGKAFELLLEKRPGGILLLPGMELNTSIGHVLAIAASPEIYGEKEFLKKGLEIERAAELAKQRNVLLSVAHPWGFSYDSAAYIIGEKRLEKAIAEFGLGVEAFNGMMGSVGNFVYGTSWVKKPLNFFDFLEKNRVARKTRLDRLGKRLKRKIDKKSREVVERCAKPLELGNKASFITAGSDAHAVSRIGSGIMKIKVHGKIGNAELLAALQKKKNVVWAGPFVEERRDGSYRVIQEPPNKTEIIAGIKYATISRGRSGLGAIGKKIKGKIKGKGKK